MPVPVPPHPSQPALPAEAPQPDAVDLEQLRAQEQARAAALAMQAIERNRRITAAAYRIARSKGFPSETVLDDWRAAEREVAAEEARQGGAATPAPSGPLDH